MEPIEPPPGGDCDLRDIKARLGRRLALKGNINTFHLLRYGRAGAVLATGPWMGARWAALMPV